MKPDTGHYSACSSTSSAASSAPTSSTSSQLPNFPSPVGPFSRRGLHLSSAFFVASLTPRPHRGLLVFPLVTVLEEVVSRLVNTTIVLRAPLAVVVRYVIRALQVHAREGMPVLELA